MPGDHHLGARHDGAEGLPHHGGSPGKTNCEDFCGKSTISVPALKSSLDNAPGDGLQPPAVTLAPPVPAFVLVPPWEPLRAEGWVLSIPIALLRLEL